MVEALGRAMVEGIGGVISAAAGYASNLFAYFSPSRSPYYAMTVAAVVGLCWIFDVQRGAWIAAFVPICLVMLVLAALTMRTTRYLFNKFEYNDQLKFARSLAVTTALICMAVLVLNQNTLLGYPLQNVDEHGALVDGAIAGCLQTKSCRPMGQWTNLIAYVLCLSQMLLFLAYAFLFVNFDERIQTQGPPDPAADPRAVRLPERNYVQIALIMSAYLAGFTFISDHTNPKGFVVDGSLNLFEICALTLLGMLWAVCAVQVMLFVARNFRLEIPPDVELLNPPSSVVAFKQVA